MKKYFLIMLLPLFVSSAQAGIIFAEFNEFTANTQSIDGTLNGVGFRAQITSDTNASLWKTGKSVFDNTSSLFSNSAFTGATDNVDRLQATRVFADSNVSLSFIFDSPLTDVTLHFAGVDYTRWLVESDGTSSLLSGNAQALFDNSSLSDINPLSSSSPEEEDSAKGSLLFTGQINTITLSVAEMFGALNDGFSLQLSVDTADQTPRDAVDVPEPSMLALLSIGLLALVRRSKKR